MDESEVEVVDEVEVEVAAEVTSEVAGEVADKGEVKVDAGATGEVA